MSIKTAPGRRFEPICWVLLLSLAGPQISYAVEPGSAAPNLTLPILNNATLPDPPPVRAANSLYTLVNLADFQGKVVYLDFWDTSCAPCRESLPRLSAMIEQFRSTDVVIISVNLDSDPNRAIDFLSSYPVSFPVVSDPSAVSASRYGVTSLPTSVFIDREGMVVHVHQGFRSSDIISIEEQLATLIAAG